VNARCLLADEQRFSDLSIRGASGDLSEHLALSLGQTVGIG
jgi:hypothetical protein